MSALNFIKFFGIFAFALMVSSACRFRQSPAGDAAGPPAYTAEQIISEIPFPTREPEIFRAEIVITAGGAEKRIFVARSGARRRFDYNPGAKARLSLVETDKHYLIVESRKIYAENAPAGGPAEETEPDFSTTEWLAAGPEAKFFKLEPENGLTRYRVVFAANEAAESVIYIDEAIGFPVRQEFYSIADGQRTLTMSVEFKDLKLEAGDDLFAVPKDFKKVSIEELRAALKKETIE